MGVTNYKIQGFTVGTTNFQYGEDVQDTKSPYEMTVDYGASTVAGGSLAPMNMFRIAQSYIVPENATVDSIKGWVTSNTTSPHDPPVANITIAICRFVVDPTSTANVVPTVISEFSVLGGGNNSMLVAVDIQSIGVDIAKSDIIFPMIKEEVAGSNLFMNLTLQTVTF